MNLNLICIRHGQSEANADVNIYYSKPDHLIELTELGLQQAKYLKTNLEGHYGIKDNNRIITSPWTRAKQTANELQDLSDYTIIEDPLIHEMIVMASFEEMKNLKDFNDPKRHEFSPYWHKTGSSVSYVDAYQRARIFIQDLLLNRYGFNDNDNIFIVSHGIFLSMLEVALNNQPIEKEKHLSNCKYFTHRLTNVREK